MPERAAERRTDNIHFHFRSRSICPVLIDPLQTQGTVNTVNSMQTVCVSDCVCVFVTCGLSRAVVGSLRT